MFWTIMQWALIGFSLVIVTVVLGLVVLFRSAAKESQREKEKAASYWASAEGGALLEKIDNMARRLEELAEGSERSSSFNQGREEARRIAGEFLDCIAQQEVPKFLFRGSDVESLRFLRNRTRGLARGYTERWWDGIRGWVA